MMTWQHSILSITHCLSLFFPHERQHSCVLTRCVRCQGMIPDEVFKKATVTSVEECVAAAAKIGYPIMLKASEGGGGKGIRMSANEEELKSNFFQVQNEVSVLSVLCFSPRTARCLWLISSGLCACAWSLTRECALCVLVCALRSRARPCS